MHKKKDGDESDLPVVFSPEWIVLVYSNVIKYLKRNKKSSLLGMVFIGSRTHHHVFQCVEPKKEIH